MTIVGGIFLVTIGLIAGLSFALWLEVGYPIRSDAQPEWCASIGPLCWLYEWQTLIAAGIAGSAAFWIGYSQLRPLLKSQQLTERDDQNARNAKCVDFGYFLELSIDDIRTARGYFFTIDENTDIWSFVSQLPEMKNFSAYESLLKRLMGALRRTQTETLKFPIFSDSSQDLIDAKAAWFIAAGSAIEAIQTVRNRLVDAYNQDYPSKTKIASNADEESFVIGFIEDVRADGSINQLEDALKKLETDYVVFTTSLSAEIHRLSTLVLKPIH